jgi:hypothetical protein
MFCLEEGNQENIVISLEFKDYYHGTTCECRMNTHVHCWMVYLLHKGRPECPICHRAYELASNPPEFIIVQNPMIASVPPEQPRSCEIKKNSVICISVILFISAILIILRY